MQTKLKARELQAGNIHLAFSAKSKMLSSNGNRGVFVKVEKVEGTDITVQVLHNGRVMVIKNLDSRDDAWMYTPVEEKIEVVFNQKEVNNTWPKFTQKMIDNGWRDRNLAISLGDIETADREGFEGTPILYHEYEEDKYIMTRLGWLNPTTAPVWRVPRAERMGLGAVEIPLPPKHEGALVSEEFLTNLRPFMADFNDWKDKGTCGYFFFDDEMKKKEDHSHQPCHASMGRVEGRKWKYLASNHKKAAGIDAATEASYITYLTEYSPYKDLFLVRDVDYIKENGYILTLDAPAELLMSALFATRQIWEHPDYVKGGMGLYKAGLNPKAAFLFGVTATLSGENNITFGAGDRGHQHIAINRMSDACLKNFIEGTPEEPGPNYLKKFQYDLRVNKIWSKTFDRPASVISSLRNSSPKGMRGITVASPMADGCDKAADIIEQWIEQHKVTL